MQFFVYGYTGASLHPISSIVKMQKAWKGRDGRDHPAKIYLTGDRELDVHDRDIERITRQSSPVIPALPGFELLAFGYEPHDDEPGPWVHREMIIGWRDGQFGGLDPVVIDYGFDEMEDRHAILRPDGKVQTGESWFDSEDEWVASMKAQADDDHATKLEVAAAISAAAENAL